MTRIVGYNPSRQTLRLAQDSTYSYVSNRLGEDRKELVVMLDCIAVGENNSKAFDYGLLVVVGKAS